LQRLLSSLKEEGYAKGSVLVYLLVGTAGILVLGAVLLALSTTEHLISYNGDRQIKAHYLAEAGLDVGIAALSQNFLYHQDITGELDGGTYAVSSEVLSATRRRITSTAHVHGASATRQAVVSLNEFYKKSLMVANKLTIVNVNVYGYVHVNDTLHVSGQNQILDDNENDLPGGFTYANLPPQFEAADSTLGIVQDDGSGGRTVVTYTKSTPSTEWTVFEGEYLPMPGIDFEKFAGEAELIYAGNTTFTSAPPADKVLVEGNLTISPQDNFVYNGTIVVRGTVKIDGRINEGFDDNLFLLVARDDISIKKVSNTVIIGGKALLFTNSNINISGSDLERFTLRGAVLAEQVDLRDCDVIFDPTVFIDYNDYLPGFGLEVEEWSWPG